MDGRALRMLQGAGAGAPSEVSPVGVGGLGPCPAESAHRSLGRLLGEGAPGERLLPKWRGPSGQAQRGDGGDGGTGRRGGAQAGQPRGACGRPTDSSSQKQEAALGRKDESRVGRQTPRKGSIWDKYNKSLMACVCRARAGGNMKNTNNREVGKLLYQRKTNKTCSTH